MQRTVHPITIVANLAIFLIFNSFYSGSIWAYYFGAGVLLGLIIMWANYQGEMPELRVLERG